MLTKLEIAAIYAGISLLLLLVLGYRVTGVRRANQVSLGDGGNDKVLRAVRAHGNAAEYIGPGIGGLILLSLLSPVPLWLMHLAGGSLTLGRLLHAYGLTTSAGVSFGRLSGMVLTFLALLTMGAGLIWAGVAPLM